MRLNENIVLNCCNNKPKFLISYQTNSKYYVCENCLDLPYWSRGIINKEALK